MKLMSENAQRGQQSLQQLYASMESNLALAKHAEEWEWKEADILGDGVDDTVQYREVGEFVGGVYPTLKKPAIEVVEAPGDLCGNTKKLADGSPCPGCRACC